MALILDGTAGVTSPGGDSNATLTSSGNNTSAAYIPSGSTAPTNGMFLPTTNTVGFSTASTERMRLNSGGNLLIGATSFVSGSPRLFIKNIAGDANNPVMHIQCQATTTAVTMIGFYDGDSTFQGQIYVDTTQNQTYYATTSDYRLKENVAPMTGALEKVEALKPVTYNWKQSGTPAEGFIAHELAEVCPQAVIGEKDAIDEEGNIIPQMIDTSFLVATLTAAIQELKAELDATKAEVAALKAK